MTSEKILQDYLLSRAKEHGIYARKVIAAGQTGFPDILVARYGRIALVELKSPKGNGRLSKKQIIEIAALKEADINVYIIDSFEGVDNVIRQIADA